MKKSTVYITLAFILSILVIIVISLLSYNRIQNLIRDSARVEHSYQVQLRVSEMFISLRSAVSSQRGYLLSGDTVYLRNYKRFRKGTYAEWQKVDSLMKEDSTQIRNLDTLRYLLDQRFALTDKMLRIYGASVRKEMIFQDDIQSDKTTTVELLRKLHDIRKEEKKLMQGRITYKNKSEQLVPVFLLLFIILALLLLSLSFIFLRKELIRRFALSQELEVKIEALNDSNRELEQFAYVASHDLQEPLRKIMTFGSILRGKKKDRLDEEGNQLLGTIIEASKRMKQLIDDLLTFSRLMNEPYDLITTDLNLIMQQVVQDLSELIRQQQASVSYDRLPSVVAYPSQMHQLFQNILINSIKYSHSDIPPIITISSSLVKGRELHKSGNESEGKKFYKIQIRDNGIGFDQKYAEQIFTIFQRLHTKEKYGGTGIGLAICKRIVTNHNGYIEASSIPDGGATFTIYLPALE